MLTLCKVLGLPDFHFSILDESYALNCRLFFQCYRTATGSRRAMGKDSTTHCSCHYKCNMGHERGTHFDSLEKYRCILFSDERREIITKQLCRPI